MGYKKTDPCLDKAFNDERLFVLMTRDITSPRIVGEWIKENIGVQSSEKLHEALDCAIEMHQRQQEFERRKTFMQLHEFISCDKELPPANSECKVLFKNLETGKLIYWNDVEGWDAQTEPLHIEVIGWKENIRIG